MSKEELVIYIKASQGGFKWPSKTPTYASVILEGLSKIVAEEFGGPKRSMGDGK